MEDRESILDELIASVLEAEETGDAQGISTLIADHPEFREPLLAFLRDHKRLGSLLPQLFKTGTASNGRFAPPLPAETLPRSFGSYQLVERVGQGGMGVVYRAEQTHPKRTVAIKMLRDRHRHDSGEMLRFLDEARIIAGLDHPHVISIHEVGTCEDQPYYSMKWYTGGHLGLYLEKLSKDPRQGAELVEVIAGAVHHVHQRGILHRDLKPSNILLDADGKPHVSDFGLAKDLEQSQLELTATGQLVGSPSYMAPEQVKNHRAAMTTATDVYGLGAVLYALLTKVPPVQGEGLLDTLEKVKHELPTRPTLLNPRVDRNLESICLKCLAKDPERRYASALALQDDLARWREGYPIRARAVSSWERAWWWCRRNPLVTGLLALVACCVVALGISGLLLWRKNQDLSKEKTLAEQESRRASAHAAEVSSHLYAARMAQAASAWNLGDARQVEDLLKLYDDHTDETTQRGFDWYYLQNLCSTRNQPKAEWDCHVGHVYWATFSPNGQLLATAGFDTKVRVWEIPSQKLRYELQVFSDDANCVSFSPDGRFLLAAGEDGGIWVCDASTGENPRLFARVMSQNSSEIPIPVPQAHFSPDMKYVAASTWEARAILYEFPSGQIAHQFLANSAQVEAVAFSADSKILAVGDRSGLIQFLDVETRQLIHKLQESEGAVKSARFTRRGKVLATANYDGHVRLYNLDTREYEQKLELGRPARSVALSPDEKWIVGSALQGGLKLWERATGRLLNSFHGHEAETWSVEFSPNGNSLITAGSDGRVKWWNADTRETSKTLLSRSEFAPWCLAVSPDDDRLAVGWGDFRISLIKDPELANDAPNQPPLIEFLEDSDMIARQQHPVALAFTSPTELAVNTHDGELIFFDLETRKRKWTRQSRASWQCRLVLLETENAILMSDPREGVKSWSLEDGQLLREYSVDERSLWCAELSPDQTRLIALVKDGDVVLLDAQTGLPIRRFPRKAWHDGRLAFSPQGARFALRAEDHAVELWTLDAEHPQILVGFPSMPSSLAYSPDGRTLAVATVRGEITLWHVPTARLLLTLQAEHSAGSQVVFSHGGQRLNAVGFHHGIGEVRIWNAPRS